MSNEFNAGAAAGAALGGIVGTTLAGIPGTYIGTFVGGALGGLVGHAYSKKPIVGNFTTTVQNDLTPENVTLDAHQIYVRIKTGHGLTTLIEAENAASELAKVFSDRVSRLADARNKAAYSWQGAAFEAAAEAIAPLSDSFTMVQQQLAANIQALKAEIAAFAHIHSQVEDVPATPPQSGIVNSANPFQTDLDADINNYNAKAAKNVALYETYSADTAAARSQVPQSYAAPPPLSGSATSAATPLAGRATAAGQPAATNASATPGGAPPAPPSPGGASGTPGGTAVQGASANDSTGRQTSSASVPTASTPGDVPTTLPAARSTAGGPLPGQPRSAGTFDTQRKTTGAGPGIGGVGGVGIRGINTSGKPGTGGRGGPSVGPVPGQPSAVQPVGRGGAGVPGARGAAGMGGLPMAPAGRSDGEEDQEHRRKYRIEPDDKELFSTDEFYAPPVIGDRH